MFSVVYHKTGKEVKKSFHNMLLNTYVAIAMQTNLSNHPQKKAPAIARQNKNKSIISSPGIYMDKLPMQLI